MKRNNVRIIGALLVMAVCLASAAPAMAVDWEQFHYDVANTGTTSSDAPDTNETLWIGQNKSGGEYIGAAASSQAMIVGDVVYVYANDNVYALSKTNNGTELWNVSIPGDSQAWGSWASPAYSNDAIFVSGGYNLRYRRLHSPMEDTRVTAVQRLLMEWSLQEAAELITTHSMRAI